jgi:hypothetical protein
MMKNMTPPLLADYMTGKNPQNHRPYKGTRLEKLMIE